ncbi:hypothetical protein PV04_05701 [Phialophora macrospora]|uniref:Major facilitator superfamily (MFS) profile domain-containing protein n=1 Tax=Phialophora macrospora TaxID=1851006 RepID=A0A0D2FHW1_9EURO|nr:hypothetical protein PV04_05701 [Phialophora macrospora]
MALKGNALMIGITSACGMGFLLFGYDQGVMGGVLGGKPFNDHFNNPSALQQGLIVGLYDLGCLIGSVAFFWASEPLGRKKSIYIGAIIVIIGTILQVTANSVGHLIAGRIVTGVGVGINTAIIPTWQAEVSSVKRRAALLTISAALITCGFTISNFVCYGTSFNTTNFQWQFPIALQVLFAVYLLVAIPFLVESPRWIANHRSLAEASTVISRLRDLPEDHPEVANVVNEIATALQEEKGGKWTEIFHNGGQQNFRRMMLGVGGLYMQQLCGINAVAYYIAVILNVQVGLSSSLAHILASVSGLQCFLICISSIFFINRISRRQAMMWGAVAQATVFALVCVGFNISPRGGGILVTTMFFLFFDAFALSYLNVPWMYAPEINSLKMRSKGAALASASNWLFNGIVVTITPIALSHIGWRYWLIWAVFNISFVPMVYFLYPETRGLTLEQIDHIFAGHKQGLTQGVKESTRMPRFQDGLLHPIPVGTGAEDENEKGVTEVQAETKA